MKKNNTIHFTGGPNATLAFVAKHKNNGTAIMRVYPLLFRSQSRKPIPANDYNKEDAIGVFKFEDSQAIDTLIHFLNHMKDNQIYIEGQRAAYDNMEGQYNANLEAMHKEVEGLSEEVSNFIGTLTRRQPQARTRRTVIAEMGTGFQSMPDDVFDQFLGAITAEVNRREIAKKKAEEEKDKGGENKEKLKEEKPAAETVAE